ncbi:tetratricopeptide repeat protein [Geothermobacter ehrlichii]|uniref:Tetratricopeptide repeat protein n=1 Tax=Geothermobacter ehrlichii TaxID=213224 RepID=A0A5D3WJS4_9BACT|nr:tetratricopeptide repeat protein [Geothermobacter ehrlichii]TYO98817.1 tetratricopeptide repeat protein [Geothermobacter ehrlichii]
MFRRKALLLLLFLLAACVPVNDTADGLDPEVHVKLGLSYLQEGDATRALKEFLQAVEGAPRNAEAQAGLAQVYHLKKAFELAEKHYLEAIALSGNNPEYHNNLGALYLDMKRWDDAIRHFRLAAENLLFDRPALARTGMAVAQLKKGDNFGAIESCKAALLDDYQLPQAHFFLGEAYQALGRLDEAIASYRQALNLAPNYLLAHYQLGMAYLKQKKNDLVRPEFEKVIELAPQSEQARLSREYLKLLD